MKQRAHIRTIYNSLLVTIMTSRVLVINCVVAVLFSSAHSLDTPDGIPVIIGRRQSGDIYYLNQSSQGLGICSEGENTTYLVVDRCCVSTLNLLNGNLTNACSTRVTYIRIISLLHSYVIRMYHSY